MTFDQFKNKMFRENISERIMWGIPVIQYKQYCEENKEFLQEEFSKFENQKDKEDE